MTDERLDFSALAASPRLEERLDALVARAARLRRRQLGVLGHLERWSRPALALATAAALVSWLRAAPEPPPVSDPSLADNPAAVLLMLANQYRVPAGGSKGPTGVMRGAR